MAISSAQRRNITPQEIEDGKQWIYEVGFFFGKTLGGTKD
jgi:hypothetical protein